MAIVEMSKLKLYGAGDDKQKVLDILFKSRLVQLKDVDEIEGTSVFFDDVKYKKLDSQIARIGNAIKIIEDNLPPKTKIEQFYNISSTEFENIKDKNEDIESVLIKLDELLSNELEVKKQKTTLQNKVSALMPYVCIKEKFTDFKSTKHAVFLLGQIQPQSVKTFEIFLQDYSLTCFEVCGTEGNIIKVYTHNSESVEVIKKLNELGFSKANFDGDYNAKMQIEIYNKELLKLEKEENKLIKELSSFEPYLKDLKLMYDYLSFCIEREEAENKFKCTKQAFILEAYLAKRDEKKLEKILNECGYTIEFEFLEIEKDEIPPTITKNNKVVKQFEFVTNMYSAPHYRELDPNAFLAFFFSVFFGFIMADIGYGLCLVLFGLALALKQKRNTGFKQLMWVIAIGGVFSIIFGIMFGSFFGLSHQNFWLVPEAILPNPVDNVITLLVACLAAGVVQIMVSFFLKGVLLIKRKRVLEAIFSAFTWDFFFIGLALFVLDFVGITSGLMMAGIITAVVSVAVAVIGQAIINKGFERLSKGFGALYGIINLFSDILSYARLFGLMLSGAIIGSIVNDLASGFLTSVSTFVIGAIILAIGHGFNLAMGALGAYIHVARLQYIEFFSRFYEGEGEVFVPFGSKFSYINLI